ncbi:hypothetical protein [Nocardioides sp. LS1]|uniref:hypothetical protein n=1 Tax=Nocardioides sp. LS1 TaxID=1027620 RepID=UPI000F6184E3|nr:hypothetical protein [Nocardioides sp. LS1]GCD89470.1 hypothetical protein NLS1_14760 [Nocardioides sp. LS1]
MRRRPRDLALDAWPLLLAVVLTLPLLTHGGYPLARDLVFVPHQPWTDASVGLGDAAPRAVPLDAVVSLLTKLVDGGVLARLVLPLVLATAGWGTHRLVRDLGTVGRLAAGGFAVWNPYVVERLALGQWALLAAYAALPWLVMAARRFREGGGPRDLGAVTAWLGLAALTPTGGALGALVALVTGARRARRTWWLVGVGVLLNLTWLVPSLLGPGGGTSDPAGVDAFSAGAEGPGGVLTALVGLGGIWDALSVPATRDSWWSTVTAVLVVAVLAIGARRVPDVRRLAVLGGVGLLLAFASSVPGGDDVVRWLVDTVPGAGLLRDSQKFLAPFVVLVAASFGVAADRAVAAVRAHGPEVVLAVALLAVPLPVALVPDGPGLTWDTVRPVDYPAGLDQVAALMDAGPAGARVVTLPWRSYRVFSWGNGLSSSDPALRWFDRPVLVSTDLQVGDTRIDGEGPDQPDLTTAHDVTWVLVYLDDPAAKRLDVGGLDAVYRDDQVALYRVPGAAVPPGASTGDRALVGLVDALALLVVLAGLGAALSRRRVRHEEPVKRQTP